MKSGNAHTAVKNGGIEIRADTGDVSHSVTFDANSITFTMNAAYTVDYVAFG